MAATNHYGKWVDDETPITGVISNNNILWEYISDEICIDCLDAFADSQELICPECGSENVEILEDSNFEYKCLDCGNGFDEIEENFDFFECDSSHTKLFGDWTEVTGPTLEREKELCWFIVNGIGYYPNKSGEFAAIGRESVNQIVFSKFLKKTSLCSPCYPGQGDLDSSGKFLAYDLPEELKYKFEEAEE